MRTVIYTIQVGSKQLELPPLKLSDNTEKIIDHLTAVPASDRQLSTTPPLPGTLQAQRVAEQARKNEASAWVTPNLSVKFLSEPLPDLMARFKTTETALEMVANWVLEQEAAIEQTVAEADRIAGEGKTPPLSLETMPAEVRQSVLEMTRSTAKRVGLASETDMDSTMANVRVSSVKVSYGLAVCGGKSGSLPVISSVRLGETAIR
jgi:hypothetical protein